MHRHTETDGTRSKISRFNFNKDKMKTIIACDSFRKFSASIYMGHRFDLVVVHLVKAIQSLFCHQDREQLPTCQSVKREMKTSANNALQFNGFYHLPCDGGGGDGTPHTISSQSHYLIAHCCYARKRRIKNEN